MKEARVMKRVSRTRRSHREPVRGARTLQTCWFSAKEWDVSDGGRYCGVCFKNNRRWIRRFIRQLRWGPHVSSAPVIKCRCLSAPGYMGMSPGQAQAVKIYEPLVHLQKLAALWWSWKVEGSVRNTRISFFMSIFEQDAPPRLDVWRLFVH